MNRPQVVLITGASSGIGKSAAKALLSRGLIVYAAARRTERMRDLAALGARVLPLDVTDESARSACFDAIRREQGRLDVLINNAGYGCCGAIEDVPLSEAKKQLDVNLLGAMAMAQLALPLMRAQGGGRIINMASLGSRVWFPYCGWYHASKFAIEGVTHCLRMEAAPFSVRVVLIEPGAIATGWGEIAADSLIKASGHGAYAKEATHFAAQLRLLGPGDWDRPTDCPAWDVRQLAAHVLGMAEMVASLGSFVRQNALTARAGGGVDLQALHAVCGNGSLCDFLILYAHVFTSWRNCLSRNAW